MPAEVRTSAALGWLRLTDAVPVPDELHTAADESVSDDLVRLMAPPAWIPREYLGESGPAQGLRTTLHPDDPKPPSPWGPPPTFDVGTG
ncbi:hypothetical protein [Embleya sp. NPDC001921]